MKLCKMLAIVHLRIFQNRLFILSAIDLLRAYERAFFLGLLSLNFHREFA